MPSESAPYDPFEGLEAWQYTGRGKLYVIKFTGKYGEEKYEGVQGGEIFYLSPQERRRNSTKTRDAKKDPFRNGECLPVELTEGTTDRAEIEANPHLMSDEAIQKLVAGPKGAKGDAALSEALEMLSNMVTLGRFFEAAQADGANVTLARMALINARIEACSDLDPETGKRMIPVTNERDAAELYGVAPPRTATRTGIVGASVSPG